MFMMGTSIPFSFRGQMNKGKPKWKILVKILRRSALLMAFGLFYGRMCKLSLVFYMLHCYQKTVDFRKKESFFNGN